METYNGRAIVKHFVFGSVGGAALLVGLVTILLSMGYFPTNSDVAPPNWEVHLAMRALNASVVRQAPKLTNPVPPTDENLIAGLKLYRYKCGGCHGDSHPGDFEHAYYPPVPQFPVYHPDLPEWQLFWITKHGIRYSGMPAWGTQDNDDDLWKIVTFVSRMNQQTPAVRKEWLKSMKDLLASESKK